MSFSGIRTNSSVFGRENLAPPVYSLQFTISGALKRDGLLEVLPEACCSLDIPVFGGRAAFNETLVAARNSGAANPDSKRSAILFPISLKSSFDHDDVHLKVDVPCAYALGPALARHLDEAGTQHPLLLPFPGPLLASLVDAYYAKALPLASLDHCLLLLELAVYLGNDTLALACLDYLETQAAAVLNPLQAPRTWAHLDRAQRGDFPSATPSTLCPPFQGLGKMAGEVATRLASYVDRIHAFCAETLDALTADPLGRLGDLPPHLLEHLLASPLLRCSSEALLLRLISLWSKGPSTGPYDTAAPRRRTNDALLPDRLPTFLDLTRRFVKLELLPVDMILHLEDRHPELAPDCARALVQKARLSDQLLSARCIDQVDQARLALGARPAPALPSTVALEFRNLRAVWGTEAATSPFPYPSSFASLPFVIPGAPGLWYLRVDPFSKKDADRYASYFLYSAGLAAGAVEVQLTVEVPMWQFRAHKVLRIRGGTGQGASAGIPLPPLERRLADFAATRDDRIVFT